MNTTKRVLPGGASAAAAAGDGGKGGTVAADMEHAASHAQVTARAAG